MSFLSLLILGRRIDLRILGGLCPKVHKDFKAYTQFMIVVVYCSAIGSGGPYALSAARALIDLPDMDARKIGRSCWQPSLLWTHYLAHGKLLHSSMSLVCMPCTNIVDIIVSQDTYFFPQLRSPWALQQRLTYIVITTLHGNRWMYLLALDLVQKNEKVSSNLRTVQCMRLQKVKEEGFCCKDLLSSTTLMLKVSCSLCSSVEVWKLTPFGILSLHIQHPEECITGKLNQFKGNWSWLMNNLKPVVSHMGILIIHCSLVEKVKLVFLVTSRVMFDLHHHPF